MSYGYISITSHPPKTLTWWYARKDQIDMSPSYQRKGRLWSDSDKAYLIDSIINGFDIPKLYLANFETRDSSLNKKRLPYAIIDGKQRFEALFDFFENKLVLNSDFKWRKNPKLKLGGLALRDLKTGHPEIAEEFENESWDVMNVYTENEEDINELFVRLNRSKALTGAEIRNAMIGRVSEVTRNVAGHEFFSDNIKFSTKRAGDLNAAAKVLLFEYRGKASSTKKRDLDEFAESQNIDTEKLELSGRRVISTLDYMQEIFLPKDPLLGSSGLFPVYFLVTKELKPIHQVKLREFLVSFGEKREENRENQRRNKSNINPVLSRFDVLNRSTNDLGSHIGRRDIILEQYGLWLDKLSIR